MKMKKLISTFAAVVVLLSAVSNGAVVQAPAAAGGAEIKSVLTAEVPEAAKSETAKKEAPALLKETAAQIAEDNDVFYEPGGESITVLSDSSAYINDSVSLFFTEKSTEQERQTVIDSLGGKVVGRTEFLNRYEVSVERSDIEKIDALCGELMELDAVEFASCNLVNRYEPNYVPDDPWDGFPDWSENANQWSARSSNWWLKAIDADKAWDYGDKFSHIDIGIVDSGFDVEHEDLQGKIKFPNSFLKNIMLRADTEHTLRA